MNFEELLKNIEQITQKIESGNISLDESVKLYEQAMKDCKECYSILNDAKGKIEILNKEYNELTNQENNNQSLNNNDER